MKKIKSSVYIPKEIASQILDFSGIKCRICFKCLTIENSEQFFNFPLGNKKTSYYCSSNCFNHF